MPEAAPAVRPGPDAVAVRRRAVLDACRADETAIADALVAAARLPEEVTGRIGERAAALIEGIRSYRAPFGGIDAFLQEFGLSSAEGVALMCVAEALLRIPDGETAGSLIRDKIGTADWDRHLGHADSLFVNASAWALTLTGRVLRLDTHSQGSPGAALERLVARTGESVILQAMTKAMRVMGGQFVLGSTIEEALACAREPERQGYRYSFDMLGEAARTAFDAERHFHTYVHAIDAIGDARSGRTLLNGPGLSVKLSALHPRFEMAQRDRVLAELGPRLYELAMMAKGAGVGLTIDTEEAERLELTLDLFELVYTDPSLAGWDGLGLAVQAYQKRAPFVIDWLGELARRHGRRMMVRLVKGAYWDTEIKRGQERGYDGYPVFTRKATTDVCYLACARKLFAQPRWFFPQFATHNAYTAAVILELAGGRRDFEFQRLHGMGEPLYDQLVGPGKYACRIYAPVGNHEDLLSYLVRRLLENGANNSFVNKVQDPSVPVSAFVVDPVATVAAQTHKPHPRIPLPRDLFQPQRRNSAGLDLSDPKITGPLLVDMGDLWAKGWECGPLVAGHKPGGAARVVRDPARRERTVGMIVEAASRDVEAALAAAWAARRPWSRVPVAERAAILDRAADLFEAHRTELMALTIREAGKTIADALAEVREAVDFLHYYAAEARRLLAEPTILPGPTGESNLLSLYGRGVFLCISPWNFPIAIFTGQVAAALVAGNPVIAKPAEQTPLCAVRAAQLMLAAGVPAEVLQVLPGGRETVGEQLTADRRIAGVAFTGSFATARRINRRLADRHAPIATLVAETGGLNAMIVDSSALPEQVVDDVVSSAFRSAGQRCSALRVLFLQEGIAERVLTMMEGAARELRVGDPGFLETDLGPVIDEAARRTLTAHGQKMKAEAAPIFETPLPSECSLGTFVAPQAYEIDRLERLQGEVFGPILHVIRYQRDHLDQVLDAIETSGFGLTLGVHTRIEHTQRLICERLPVGNRYVNRNMIGAVVGVQPFGGEGWSGTGPKAGGPHYLLRFVTERTTTINTTAAGGNAALVSMGEE